jgi:hypothetical protein
MLAAPGPGRSTSPPAQDGRDHPTPQSRVVGYEPKGGPLRNALVRLREAVALPLPVDQ